MRTLLLGLILTFTGTLFGQNADSWKGVVIDQTTPEQAIALLGKPATDVKEPVIDLWIGRLLSPTADLPVYRTLTYFGTDKDVPELSLAFSPAGKLVMISAYPKNTPASTLEKLFPADWRLSGEDPATNYEDWDKAAPAETSKPADSELGGGYQLLVRTPKVFSYATVMATAEIINSPKSQTEIAPGKPLWGNIMFLTMISRSLERKPGEPEANDGPIPKGKIPVMAPESSITATTSAGTIIIKAGKGLLRSYTWEGATRSVEMGTGGRDSGLGYPGGGNHWRPHNGISRGVLSEGQMKFATMAAAMKWIAEHSKWQPLVYRNDGLLVAFGKVLPRKQLNVDVLQILINGKRPTKLVGATDDKIIFKQ